MTKEISSVLLVKYISKTTLNLQVSILKKIFQKKSIFNV